MAAQHWDLRLESGEEIEHLIDALDERTVALRERGHTEDAAECEALRMRVELLTE